MNDERIDRIMKRYWDEALKHSYLGTLNGNGYEDVFGLITKKPDGNEVLIVGYYIHYNKTKWYLSDSMFDGHDKLFNLSIFDYKDSLRRYINNKHNLEVEFVL